MLYTIVPVPHFRNESHRKNCVANLTGVIPVVGHARYSSSTSTYSILLHSHILYAIGGYRYILCSRYTVETETGRRMKWKVGRERKKDRLTWGATRERQLFACISTNTILDRLSCYVKIQVIFWDSVNAVL